MRGCNFQASGMTRGMGVMRRIVGGGGNMRGWLL